MSALYSIADSLLWYIICIAALILLTGSVSILFRTVFDTREIRPLAFAVINVVFDFALFVVLMDCNRYVSPVETRTFYPLQCLFFELPWIFYAGFEIVSGVLLLICSRDNMKYRKEYLTRDAMIEAVNLLPEGISISGMDGSVRLAHLRMNDLCKSMTGELYTDAGRFWSYIEQEGKEQGGRFLIHTKDNKVWLFEKDVIEVGEYDYEQITASDVTERYKIIDELEAKNEHLQDIQRRMKAVTDLSGDMFVAQEEADARAALHNQLGQVLLMGRHYINHRDTTDPNMVYMATVQMNRFLLGESEEPYSGEEDEMDMAVAMANSIGVCVEMNGEAPVDKLLRKILATVVTECAANTVKHAEGDKITVEVSENSVSVTNNGKPPKGKITESGGLLSLRRNVENEGGEMFLEYDPVFRLTITLPNNQKNGTNG